MLIGEKIACTSLSTWGSCLGLYDKPKQGGTISRVIRRRWSADASGPVRRDRRPCDYEAYVPDPLVGRRIALDGDIAAEVADAEAAIVRLNSEASTLVDTEALARILLRAESVASSKIEGLEIGPRRLLRAEAARNIGEEPTDVTAAEVLGNVDAMAHAIALVGPRDAITVDLLLSIHQHLLARSRTAEHGGRLREEQNWIGGSDYNPCSAAFVPPPPSSSRS
jgi:Fic family protein